MAGSTPLRSKRPGSKAASYLSHEFIIQNHGDIATCICMIFVVGLMFQFTSPFASTFVALKHNVTEYSDSQPILYTFGTKDLCLLFFYSVAAVIFHAIVQEYILDKMIRKMKLSKIKASKLNESGQLVAFYLLSVVWAFFIFKEEGYFQSLSFFWTGYPQTGMTFMTKFYFIIQISYWLHTYPELYFQKIKREEYSQRILLATTYLLLTTAFYLFNFTRVGLAILTIDHLLNLVFHESRILRFSGKHQLARISFNIYNVTFVLGRFFTVILSIFVFWFGLKNSSVDSIDLEQRNFNTFSIRLALLAFILTVQAYTLWNFMLFQCKRIRETTKSTKPKTATLNAKPQTKKLRSSAAKEETASGSELDYDSDKAK